MAKKRRKHRNVLKRDAVAIWWAAVRAVDAYTLVRRSLSYRSGTLRVGEYTVPLSERARVIVVGAGKAGAAMARAVEDRLRPLVRSGRLTGWVNVPADQVEPLEAIRLHPARPPGRNEPTQEGVEGANAIEELLAEAEREDVALCLISGGGSALLPAPVPSITLQDKQKVTALLHAAGATINEINAVRKHLSRLKGGGLARAFRGRRLFSLIISDVVGDPLDVIASGPTVADPTTFDEAFTVLLRYSLIDKVPPSVVEYLKRGTVGEVPETPKRLPRTVRNIVIGNNRKALDAAAREARRLGYRVVDLGAFIEGETREVARAFAGIVRSALRDRKPSSSPLCVLSGGETTVTLPPKHGLGGRNQEFAVAFARALGVEGMRSVVCLCGGTDGEDGPTDAAGALVNSAVMWRALRQGLDIDGALARHDTYHWLAQAGGLFVTGPTGTNVTDVRVILVS